MGTAHVLVVDNDHRTLFDIAGMLEEAGFVVSTATSGDDALEVVEHGVVDVVVTDVSMPGMSGFDLIRELHRVRPDLPVLVMTSKPSPAGQQLAAEFGAIAYLRKPISALMFLDAVARAAARSRAAPIVG